MTTPRTTPDGDAPPRTDGRVLHGHARYYDLVAWLLTRGREGAFRDRLIALARLAPGEAVLDVGCGTGSLALAARRRVGLAGTVHGIDPSPAMVARARRKAAAAGTDVDVQPGVAEALPFSDARFDAVLSTLMFHHLPGPTQRQSAREMRRVLTPGGRLLVVDFGAPAPHGGGLLGHLHRHGHVPLRTIIEIVREAGLDVVESGAVGVTNAQFVLALRPRIGAVAESAP